MIDIFEQTNKHEEDSAGTSANDEDNGGGGIAVNGCDWLTNDRRLFRWVNRIVWKTLHTLIYTIPVSVSHVM